MLGMRWEGALFVDSVLPFGLRSAPKIFSAVADAVEWILKQGGVRFAVHYLDDFLVMGTTNLINLTSYILCMYKPWYQPQRRR